MSATGFTKGDPQKVARAGDTMTGELILPDSSPDTALAATSRGYVDNKTATLSGSVDAQLLAVNNRVTALSGATDNKIQALSGVYVDVTGDTMTGALTLSGNPVSSLHAAPKQYVDNTTVSLTGDTMTGPLVFTTASGLNVPSVQEALSTVLSTGVVSGGEINPASNTTVAISGLVGYVIDMDTAPTTPTLTRVQTSNQVVALTGDSLTRTITWWLMTSTGSIIQQATRPTNAERRTSLVLGATAYDTGLGAIFIDQSLPVVQAQPANQLADLMDALGPFSISGNVAGPDAANLQFTKTAGTMFSRAFNHFAGPVLTNDPHVFSTPAHTPATFRRILRVASLPTPPAVTTIDPGNYDVGGVLTAVPGSANTSTVQRIWLSGTNDAEDQILVQYGQVTFANLDAAQAGIGTGVFIPAPVTADSALIGWLCLIKGATNLSDTSQARFIKAGRFATP